MEDKEDNFLQLSALQHFLFCERQCALIHIEQIWHENRFTLEGEFLHEKADDQKLRERGDDVRIESGLLIKSLTLGLTGKTDIVEFHKGQDGVWHPFPVEYKRGKPKENRCDEVQLCAQALCLEEMLALKIHNGALYYGKTRHRHDVQFDEPLRNLTEQTIEKLHSFIEAGATPPAIYEKEKCSSCSLLEQCMPRISRKNVSQYLSSMSSVYSVSSTSSNT